MKLKGSVLIQIVKDLELKTDKQRRKDKECCNMQNTVTFFFLKARTSVNHFSSTNNRYITVLHITTGDDDRQSLVSLLLFMGNIFF